MNVTAYIGPPPPEAHGLLYDYQSLVGAILALVAALIAVEISRRQLGAAHAQLAEAKRQADRDRNGRLRAARASLPAVLSAICDYAEEVAKSLNGAWPGAAAMYPDDVDPLQSYRIVVQVRTFPAETLQSLERVVELTDDDVIAKRVESILREAQVLAARTRKLGAGDEIGTHMLSAYILQTASLYARAESLFEYARRQSEGLAVEPLWDRVFAALNIMGIHRDEVVEMGRGERARGEEPGEADTQPVY